MLISHQITNGSSAGYRSPVLKMTEIPLPGDYGTSEPPKSEESKGCCARLCECWIQLVCGFALLIVVLAILLSLGP